MAEAKDFSEKGLAQNPDNEELKKLKKQIDSQISELQQREAEVSKALKTAKVLHLAYVVMFGGSGELARGLGLSIFS